ncbi:MAG: peptide-methionine (S)-S-oxide reductase MsrA [Alphaproteobacteria bacterium]|nr:peptide-methionine (S)-S-oxide reductase MsrA [Alphaproteobacteria bacterium]
MLSFLMKKIDMPTAETALKGRDEAVLEPNPHAVNGNPIVPPFPAGLGRLLVGMGCFWGAERVFWQTPGVFTTSVGYAGGHTINATYQEVCSGATGHTEVVEVIYDPKVIDTAAVLKIFWENHDPTQGMRQGNDVGTQYRSAIYADDEATLTIARQSRDAYNAALQKAGRPAITTEIGTAGQYYLAEDYHQQYLHKNPGGYCGIAGCGVKFEMPAPSAEESGR